MLHVSDFNWPFSVYSTTCDELPRDKFMPFSTHFPQMLQEGTIQGGPANAVIPVVRKVSNATDSIRVFLSSCVQLPLELCCTIMITKDGVKVKLINENLKVWRITCNNGRKEIE